MSRRYASIAFLCVATLACFAWRASDMGGMAKKNIFLASTQSMNNHEYVFDLAVRSAFENSLVTPQGALAGNSSVRKKPPTLPANWE